MRSQAPDYIPDRNLAALWAVLEEMWPGGRGRRRIDPRLAVADVLWALGWDRAAALRLVARGALLDQHAVPTAQETEAGRR